MESVFRTLLAVTSLFTFCLSSSSLEAQEPRVRATLEGHTGCVYIVAFSPDGKTLASGDEDGKVRLWDVATGRNTANLSAHRHSVRSLTFSPDGKALASAGMGFADDQVTPLPGEVKLWDVATRRNTATLQGHEAGVLSVAFSPDGKTLASASSDKTVKLWNVVTGRDVTTLKGHDTTVGAVAFSPDGRTLASGSLDRTVRLWNLATEQCTKTLRHAGKVVAVAFCPNGKTLASGIVLTDEKNMKFLLGEVYLWDVSTGQRTVTFQGHEQAILSLAISPDGKTIASGSADNTVRLWDVGTGKSTHTLRGHQQWVYCVAISPDGKALAAGTGDRTIKLWSLMHDR